jgi:hypothetical protein
LFEAAFVADEVDAGATGGSVVISAGASSIADCVAAIASAVEDETEVAARAFCIWAYAYPCVRRNPGKEEGYVT